MQHVETSLSALEQLRRLPAGLTAHEGFVDVLCALHDGQSATIDGAWGSSCALVAAALAAPAPSTVLVVSPRQHDIDDLCDDLAIFLPQPPERFPAWETAPGEQLVSNEIYRDRIRTLKQLLAPAPPRLIVTSIQSLLQPVPSRQRVADDSLCLVNGQTMDVDQLARWLVERGLARATAGELPGEFSARGGIVDIFAPDWELPVRVELFGDQVESMRQFDPATQRSVSAVDEIEIALFSGNQSEREHFMQFLPSSSWVVLIEPEQIQEEGSRYQRQVVRPDALDTLDATMGRIGQLGHVSTSALAPGGHEATCRLAIQSVERFSGDVARVRDELDQIGEGQQVFLLCQTEAEWQRLQEVFSTTRLAAQGRLQYCVGRLQAGFHLVREAVLVVSGAELFHRAALRRPPRRGASKPIDSFLDLRDGDLVVHLAHGVGRYRGIKLLDGDNQREDHLEVEFHGGTKVYVPASKIELVQKYVGGRKSRPSLAKIGGKTWVRQKLAAEASVTDLAADMLSLQAARAARPGIAFDKDSQWQQEFDASFPYHETPDQEKAMQALKADMGRARPMDRLLCGDVGFGKTELAMRAAFKAVDNGFQVAVLVPTTILAEQHHRTFQERMAEFPFVIAKLSRFCTPREQRDVLDELRRGRIDIVIGTHRLVSRDVEFHNLGLVVIDEEQRFGVEVKERLKALRTEVDVMTMTATPIPRTLHMALVGLRDLSNLETPPEGRMAVETRVLRWNETLIREAVLRELARGGQIYFVHNRIEDIDAIAHRLKRIVPEARLGIGHGKMPEGQLEQVMVDFVSGRFDLLLATTIVESGLDIPIANTMFIDDADRYGLADLHQLRGRVGRYKHRAYCFLLIAPRQHVTPNAARRLRAIEEFSDMGAGFAIAMRDLEFRGAGNVLGTEQSGHIAAVGYELYCQLLEAAVRRLKNLPPKQSIDVSVDLPGPAYFPPDYVPNQRMKIDLYRRLARIAGEDELEQLRVELIARFGPPPLAAARMLAHANLRIDAAVWQINAVHMEDHYLVFTYTDRARIEQLSRYQQGRMRIVDQRSAYLPLPKGITNCDEILQQAKSVLRPI